MFTSKRGFTLAEVLITLALIGVVASMSIPALMKSQEKSQIETRLKKAYVTWNEALKRYAADQGCVNDLKCSGLFDGTNLQVGERIAPYFNISKNCKTNQNEGCAATVNNNFDGSGGFQNMDSNTYYKFITADGFSYIFQLYGNNCSNNVSTEKLGHMKQTCGSLRIDVNGPNKGPNYMGRDVFHFFVTNGKGPLLYPDGGMDDALNGDTTRWWRNPDGSAKRCTKYSTGGWQCAGRVMEEGWKINYLP